MPAGNGYREIDAKGSGYLDERWAMWEKLPHYDRQFYAITVRLHLVYLVACCLTGVNSWREADFSRGRYKQIEKEQNEEHIHRSIIHGQHREVEIEREETASKIRGELGGNWFESHKYWVAPGGLLIAVMTFITMLARIAKQDLLSRAEKLRKKQEERRRTQEEWQRRSEAYHAENRRRQAEAQKHVAAEEARKVEEARQRAAAVETSRTKKRDLVASLEAEAAYEIGLIDAFPDAVMNPETKRFFKAQLARKFKERISTLMGIGLGHHEHS